MKARVIHTKIWIDPWFKKLNRASSHIFLYLISNQHIGLTGIYELSDEQVCFEAGVTQTELLKAKKDLKGKINFYNGWIKITNSDKYQTFKGPKNEIAKENELKLISSEVVDTLSIPYRYPIDTTSNPYPVISNKYSVISNKKLKQEDLKEIANKYKVNLESVRELNESMELWLDEKPERKKGRNFKKTLMNWLRRDIKEGKIKSYKQTKSRLTEILERKDKNVSQSNPR